MIGASSLLRQLGNSGGAPPLFDPATLALTGWYRADFAGSPWSGSPSAGSSGARSISEATTPPSVITMAGADVADFDGSNDFLGQTSGDIEDYFNAGSGTIAALVNVDTITGGDSVGYNNPAIVAETGGFLGLFVGTSTNDKFLAYMIDGVERSIEIAAVVGSWAFLFMTWDGSNLKFSLNNGTLNSTACGSAASMAGALRVGRGYTANFFNGKAAEIFLADTALTLTNRDNIRAYINGTYTGVSV